MHSHPSACRVHSTGSATCLGDSKSDLLEAVIPAQEVDDEHHSYSRKSIRTDTYIATTNTE